ncbi:hypothetical protein DsansV1_C26g0193991 [Dioscorea sansibarensis]
MLPILNFLRFDDVFPALNQQAEVTNAEQRTERHLSWMAAKELKYLAFEVNVWPGG